MNDDQPTVTSGRALVPGVAEALGAARMSDLAELGQRVQRLQQVMGAADTNDVMLVPLDSAAARRCEVLASLRGEDWVYLDASGGKLLAVDEPSGPGMRDPGAAVTYPELHSRLVSWWLVHAWRATDLLESTSEDLCRWRITTAAVTARAVIEQSGCLLTEATKLAEAWGTAKAIAAGSVSRPAAVREALAPVITQAALGSRMKGSHEKAQATNVLTYVQRLAKATADARFARWYDWLSDAAHPAFGARIALATQPIGHDSGAYTVRYYARTPLELQSGDGSTTPMTNEIALLTADALIAGGAVLCRVLGQALAVIDDFGLTTGAATLTRRSYWRSFAPVRGKRDCPCGQGKWSQCGHRWGEPAPTIRATGG